MTTLALPTKVAAAVTPKPTKKEIVTAMVHLHIKKHNDDVKAKVEERSRLIEQATVLLREYVAKNIGTLVGEVGTGSREYNYSKGEKVFTGAPQGVRVVFNLSKLPKQISSLLMKSYDIPESFRDPDPKQLRNAMELKLEGIGTETERVEALLTDPESRKGLEKMLKVIGY